MSRTYFRENIFLFTLQDFQAVYVWNGMLLVSYFLGLWGKVVNSFGHKTDAHIVGGKLIVDNIVWYDNYSGYSIRNERLKGCSRLLIADKVSCSCDVLRGGCYILSQLSLAKFLFSSSLLCFSFLSFNLSTLTHPLSVYDEWRNVPGGIDVLILPWLWKGSCSSVARCCDTVLQLELLFCAEVSCL